MPRPGTDIFIVDGGSPGGPSLDTGQAFFAGTSERAPGDVPPLHSQADYKAKYGDRPGGSLLYDSASAFFAEGGETLYVAPVTGAGAAVASGAFGSATAKAAGPGVWGNSVTIEASAPSSELELLFAAALAAGDPIVAVVKYKTVVVERSTVLASVDELVQWAVTNSDYVRVTKGADNVLPAAGVIGALTGGTAGSASTAADLGLALARFPFALGPGQVAAPGMSALASQQEVLKHIDATKRCGLLDLADTSDSTALAAAVGALYTTKGCRFAAAFAPWLVYPADTSPATVTIPYSGVQAGMIARVDALGNPNQLAAGVNGISRNALALSQVYSDVQRQALNGVGATLAKQVYGDVRTYGGRTVSGPNDTNWLWFGNSRVVMAIAHEADAVAETYVLQQVDGRRTLFAAFESDLTGMLLGYFNAGALYGDTPADAFHVDTSESINTIETIAAGEVHAAIYLKCSPAAEYVRVDVVKVPVERSLPTAA